MTDEYFIFDIGKEKSLFTITAKFLNLKNQHFVYKKTLKHDFHRRQYIYFLITFYMSLGINFIDTKSFSFFLPNSISKKQIIIDGTANNNSSKKEGVII